MTISAMLLLENNCLTNTNECAQARADGGNACAHGKEHEPHSASDYTCS